MFNKQSSKSSELSIDFNEKKKRVNAYFETESSFWEELYQQNDVYAIIHQRRRAVALTYFDELSLPKGSRILEIGCGAGFTSVDIAKKGYSVEAIDSVEAMVEKVRVNVRNEGVEKQVSASVGDVNQLTFKSNQFDLIILLGVTPWLANLNQALSEISRVLMPGGYVILNADNRYRLNHLIDPANMPVLEKFKMAIKSMLIKSGMRKLPSEPPTHRYSRKKFDLLLNSAGLKNIKNTMLGFGPFSFLKFNIISDSLGVKIHHLLQGYADRGFPVFRSTGAQYLILARKN